jgi:ABC-type antimicrobial peptide transport system permease subunit
VVLLKPIADKLFGNEDPIGKVVRLDDAFGKVDLTVGGVVDESLGKSHIHADFFMSMNSSGFSERFSHDNSWAGSNFIISYVKLRPHTDVAVMEKAQYEIAGVMKDYNFSSLHEDIKPLLLLYDPAGGSEVLASTNSGNYEGLLEKIGAIWHKDVPGVPFEFTFVDAQVQKQYAAEITLSNIINSFTLIAICISSLGLLGLAAFSAERRIKEIGVRKVLGASVLNLTALLSKDFLKLVGIAILIARPIAWWAMDTWLESFAYRVPIVWWMFALAGGVALLIALVTVSSQAVRAAVANPVKSLKTD